MSVVQCDCSEIERAGSILACAKIVQATRPLCTERVGENLQVLWNEARQQLMMGRSEVKIASPVGLRAIPDDELEYPEREVGMRSGWSFFR